MAKTLCSISIDLDPLSSYYEIHGLGDPPRQVRRTILRKVLPRFAKLFEETNIKATFFVVGSEIEKSDEAQQTLQELASAGHELANHTYNHPYELCRLPPTLIEEEIHRGHEVVANLMGGAQGPVGFRSPGYSINSKVMDVLLRHNYLYDSSVFPSPPYYLAKIGVMLGMALRGRRSSAVLGDPRGLTAPIDPYRPDPKKPWREGRAPITELPVAVLPMVRFPPIGTFLAIAPYWLRDPMLRQMKGRPLYNLELHGIDLADAIEDRIPTELAGRQPDLRVPFEEKRSIFRTCIEQLKSDFEFVTLRDAADRLNLT